MQQGMEISFFSRKENTTEEQVLEAVTVMQNEFLKREPDLISHNTVKLGENLYADVVVGMSKESVEKICAKWGEEKSALSFLEYIEPLKMGALEVLNFGDVVR